MTLRLSKETLRKLNSDESQDINAGQDMNQSDCACCQTKKGQKCCTACGKCQGTKKCPNNQPNPTKQGCNPDDSPFC